MIGKIRKDCDGMLAKDGGVEGCSGKIGDGVEEMGKADKTARSGKEADRDLGRREQRKSEGIG